MTIGNCPFCKSPHGLKPMVGGGFTWACNCDPPETYTSSYTSSPPVKDGERSFNLEHRYWLLPASSL